MAAVETRIYWQAVRDRVCTVCLDSDGHGNCRIDSSHECTIQKHLPLIVGVVNSAENGDMNACLRELRGTVCSRCRFQTVNGYCTARENIDCALDRYFPLVVGAIRGVTWRERWSRASG